MKFVWRGETFEMVEQSELSWAEAEELEEATGYTSSELEEDKRLGGKARVIAAMCWLSVKKQNEQITWAEYFGSKLGDFEAQREDEEETVPPAPVDPDDPLDGSAGSISGTSGTST